MQKKSVAESAPAAVLLPVPAVEVVLALAAEEVAVPASAAEEVAVHYMLAAVAWAVVAAVAAAALHRIPAPAAVDRAGAAAVHTPVPSAALVLPASAAAAHIPVSLPILQEADLPVYTTGETPYANLHIRIQSHPHKLLHSIYKIASLYPPNINFLLF